MLETKSWAGPGIEARVEQYILLSILEMGKCGNKNFVHEHGNPKCQLVVVRGRLIVLLIMLCCTAPKIMLYKCSITCKLLSSLRRTHTFWVGSTS